MRPLLSFLLIVFLAVPTVLAPAQESTGPRAVPVEPVKNFDNVAKGESLVHAFEIKNEGDKKLIITNVSPACGCTVAEFDKEIAPGAIGRVRATVDTSTFEGPIAKTIAVLTNDPNTPKLQLTVRAVVKPYVGIRPGYARYIYVQGEETTSISQTLWAEDGQDMKIVSIKSGYDFIRVKHHEATADERRPETTGKQWVVEIDISPDAPVGPLREYIDIELDHPKQHILKVPVTGFVRPRQHLTPDTVEVGQLSDATLPWKRSVTFTNFTSEPIKVTKIETGIEGMEVKVEDVGRVAGHRFKLELRILPSVAKGAFDTEVKIHTSDKLNPIVSVPIKGTVI